jgi:hypothetical protein
VYVREDCYYWAFIINFVCIFRVMGQAMTGISKEDVLSWYQGLNAPHRVEIICALLDHSLPFELRFLGSVIENLGRKDFHVLRDAECKANSLHSAADPSQEQTAILKFLSEGPSLGGIAVSSSGITGSLTNASANTNSTNGNEFDEKGIIFL